ncbi:MULTISPECIES: hypothetical protein [Vibrio]|nr:MULTISPECIES: hypothetical protein [Vibrio]EJC6859581.1 hypothetical protein [Vibrio parahaemolyticus]EME0894041.1 hypothetical protein [Vibrio parahaemolyticus]MBM4835745.1 hypothetical protein [Vibrio parahaemolyticus]MBM4958089.1 hypothetical protein [Vibrio parahaemolyticus]MCS0322352.1 hypothetical protein [Vibrio diabolicus]
MLKNVHIVNMAENSRTNRAKRHVKIFERLILLGNSGYYFTTNFDHASKGKISKPAKDYEVDIWIPGYKSHTGLMRMVTNIVFSIILFWKLLMKTKKDDIVVVSSIPTEIAFSVSLLKLIKKNLTLVIDVRDVWPDSFPGVGLKKSIFSMYCDVINCFSYKRADEVIYVNEDFSKFLKRNNCFYDKSTYIPLGADLTRWQERSGNIEASDLRFTKYVYVGNFNKQFDLSVLGDAFLSSNEKDISLIGDGELIDKYRLKIPNANFMGFLPQDTVVNSLRKCEVGLLPISGGATLPNKLYDYILSGLDIVTNSKHVARYLSLTEPVYDEDLSLYYIDNDNCNRNFIIDYEDVSSQFIKILNKY